MLDFRVVFLAAQFQNRWLHDTQKQQVVAGHFDSQLNDNVCVSNTLKTTSEDVMLQDQVLPLEKMTSLFLADTKHLVGSCKPFYTVNCKKRECQTSCDIPLEAITGDSELCLKNGADPWIETSLKTWFIGNKKNKKQNQQTL